MPFRLLSHTAQASIPLAAHRVPAYLMSIVAMRFFSRPAYCLASCAALEKQLERKVK